MAYLVTTEQELLTAIENASDYDIIEGGGNYIDVKTVDIRLMKYLKFQKLWLRFVTRTQVKKFTDPHWMMASYRGVEITNNCSWVGLKLRYPKDWQSDGLQTLLKTEEPCNVLHIDKSVFKYANYAAIWDSYSNITFINNSRIAECAVAKHDYGLGYGYWKGGSGLSKNQMAFILNCLFSNNRHCIAAHYANNSLFVSGNTFNFGTYSKAALDRHGEYGYGGGDYTIVRNKFNNPNNYAYSLSLPPTPYRVLIEENEFARPFLMNGEFNNTPEIDIIGEPGYENIVLKNNVYAEKLD